jgi:hypothetical protein
MPIWTWNASLGGGRLMDSDQTMVKIGEYTAYLVIILLVIWGLVKFVKSRGKK